MNRPRTGWQIPPRPVGWHPVTATTVGADAPAVRRAQVTNTTGACWTAIHINLPPRLPPKGKAGRFFASVYHSTGIAGAHRRAGRARPEAPLRNGWCLSQWARPFIFLRAISPPYLHHIKYLFHLSNGCGIMHRW